MDNTTDFHDALIAQSTKLYNFAYSMTGSEEEAKDLVQETLLKAFSNKEKFQPNTNLTVWLFTILKNTFINQYHKKKISTKYAIDNFCKRVNLEIATKSDIEHAYNIKEINKIIDTAISEEQRIPFLMFVNGYKYKEIAAHLNIPLGTVKSRIFFTRQKLMTLLRDFT